MGQGRYQAALLTVFRLSRKRQILCNHSKLHPGGAKLFSSYVALNLHISLVQLGLIHPLGQATALLFQLQNFIVEVFHLGLRSLFYSMMDATLSSCRLRASEVFSTSWNTQC